MPHRLLLITADDFGVGPETTRGILDAALCGVVTSSVVLVNSPYAEDAVRVWESLARPVELGWHPCLTLDSPVLPPDWVPSLVEPDGRFHSLGRFMRLAMLGRISSVEVRAELKAQYARFVELVGRPPANVNAHHHIHVFRVVGEALSHVLADQNPRPFFRRVVESRRTLRKVPGARPKRTFLALQGRAAARRQARSGIPGNDTLLGVTDPQYVSDPEFFKRWLAAARGQHVELACHPGHPDPTLAGRDDDPLNRRPHELELLLTPEFQSAVRAAGFELVTATDMATALTHGASPVRRVA